MESTNSAFSANETALDPNSACCCAEKYQDAVSPEFDLAQRRAAAQVDAKGRYEPCLSEHGIPSDVLAKLLPGDDVIELVEPKVNGGLGYRFVKRAFDVVSCGCALIVLAIPMAIIAAKIKLESPGPVIYSQRRVGKNSKIFNVYKFRSMYTDAEARGARWAAGDDPRVTPFGKFMREKRIDEIPQFWNIVKGGYVCCRPTAYSRHPFAHARTASASVLRPPRRAGAGKTVFGFDSPSSLPSSVSTSWEAGCGGDDGVSGRGAPLPIGAIRHLLD